jgi:hypothetical protein
VDLPAAADQDVTVPRTLGVRENSAYAWRQMLFHVSVLDRDTQRRFVAWAREHLAVQSPHFVARFEPALAGLDEAVGGAVPHVAFLGWSTGDHFLLRDSQQSAMH